MLERLVEQRDAVTLVLAGIPSVKNLNAQQWATAADLIVALRPFMDVTELMSGATYPTLLMVIPVLDGLKDLLRQSDGGLDVLRAIFVRLLDEKFGDPYADSDLCVATVADPRFQMVPFDTDDRRRHAREATLAVMQKEAAAGAVEPALLRRLERRAPAVRPCRPSQRYGRSLSMRHA